MGLTENHKAHPGGNAEAKTGLNHPTHYETAEQDKISLAQKLIYGLGGFVNNLLAAAIGGMTIVLNLGLGMNPALVGLLGALPRLTDALTDPIMGYLSDHTKSRWGRRSLSQKSLCPIGSSMGSFGVISRHHAYIRGSATKTWLFQDKKNPDFSGLVRGAIHVSVLGEE